MRADEATKFIAVGFLSAFWPVKGRASTRVRTPLLTNCLLQTLFGRTVGQASDKLSVAMTSVGLDVGLCSFLQWFGFYKFLAFTILPQAPLSIYYYETCSFFFRNTASGSAQYLLLRNLFIFFRNTASGSAQYLFLRNLFIFFDLRL